MELRHPVAICIAWVRQPPPSVGSYIPGLCCLLHHRRAAVCLSGQGLGTYYRVVLIKMTLWKFCSETQCISLEQIEILTHRDLLYRVTRHLDSYIILKSFWGVPQACGPLLQLATAQAGQGNCPYWLQHNIGIKVMGHPVHGTLKNKGFHIFKLIHV